MLRARSHLGGLACPERRNGLPARFCETLLLAAFFDSYGTNQQHNLLPTIDELGPYLWVWRLFSHTRKYVFLPFRAE